MSRRDAKRGPRKLDMSSNTSPPSPTGHKSYGRFYDPCEGRGRKGEKDKENQVEVNEAARRGGNRKLAVEIIRLTGHRGEFTALVLAMAGAKGQTSMKNTRNTLQVEGSKSPVFSAALTDDAKIAVKNMSRQ